MLEVLTVSVLALLVVAAAAVVAPKVGVAAPLVLVLVGIGISLAPVLEDLVIDPEWISRRAPAAAAVRRRGVHAGR